MVGQSATEASRVAAAGMLSVVIKAYNEATKIAAAIESALAAAPEIWPLTMEVVVADSLSSDDTVAIASRYPVRVVRLRNAHDRGCGAGVQLGYEWTRGDWVYLMDGDMQLTPGFLAEALALLRANPSLAGVGGAVIDSRIRNDFDRIRVNNRSGSRGGPCSWLEGGGLYRRQAIEAAGGHAANRNLRGYEEAELGLRLGAAGWALHRLPRQAVTHEGHDADTWTLMRRHWRNRRAMSAGMMLRLAAGRPWLGRALRLHLHPLLALVWWLMLLAGLVLAGPALRLTWLVLWSGASVLAWLLLAWRKRDLRHATISVYSWHYGLAAIVLGLFEPLVPSSQRLEADLVHDAVPAAAPAPGPAR